MHANRNLYKWYHFVHGTILIKNQDANTWYFGWISILDDFQNGRHENIEKKLYGPISAYLISI